MPLELFKYPTPVIDNGAPGTWQHIQAEYS